MKQPESSLADKLNIRAATALDEADKMPAGDARREAMRKARILRNAAEMHEHFFGNDGASAKRGGSAPSQIPPLTHHD